MRKSPPHAVASWPDASDSPMEVCAGTLNRPGCGRRFGVIAACEARRCGRHCCPHCGAPRRIPDALHDMYLRWIGLINQGVRKCRPAAAEFTALQDAAHDAYVEALLKWLPDQGAFSTFATHLIRWKLKRVGRELRARPAAGPLLAQPLAAPLTDPVEAEDEATATADRVAAALAKLNGRTASVIRARFGIGEPAVTLREIAERVGLSKERVRQIELAGVRRLRKLLGTFAEL